MGTKEEICKKIKALREKKALTQAEAADKAGIHVNYFARVERGEVRSRLIFPPPVLDKPPLNC